MTTEVAQIPVQIWQAGIAGSVVAAGWLVNGWSSRRNDERLRLIRQRDMLTALSAEVRHYLDALELFDLDSAWATTVTRMKRESGYHPLIPTEQNDRIFRALIADIPLLPHETVAPVARYYNQIAAVDAIIADLRSVDPSKTATSSRIAMYTDYISLKKEALRSGQAALDAIAQFFESDPYMVARRRAEEVLMRNAERDARISASVRAMSQAQNRAGAAAKDTRDQGVSSPGAARSDPQSAQETGPRAASAPGPRPGREI